MKRAPRTLNLATVATVLSIGAAHAGHYVAPSNEVIDQVQSDNAVNVAKVVSERFNPLFNAFDISGAPGSNGETGLASGDEDSGWSVWGSAANSWNNNTLTATKSETLSQTMTVGVDQQINERITLGASVTYTHSDTDTIYNGGNTKSHGFSLVPYMNVKLTDWLSADASFGYTRTSTDQTIAGVTSDYDTDGYTGAINLNASKWYGSWMTSAQAGLMVNSNKRATYTDSFGTVYQGDTNNLTQTSASLSLAYWMEPVMPYVSVGYAYDVSSEAPTIAGASNDKDEFRLAAGAHIYGTGEWQNVTGGFGVSTVLGRKDSENTTASLNLRVAF